MATKTIDLLVVACPHSNLQPGCVLSTEYPWGGGRGLCPCAGLAPPSAARRLAVRPAQCRWGLREAGMWAFMNSRAGRGVAGTTLCRAMLNGPRGRRQELPPA